MNEKKITLKVLVMGKPGTVEFNTKSDINGIAEKVLSKFKVTNKTVADFIIKIDDVIAELHKKLEDYEFNVDSTIYFNLKRSGGGI